MATRRSYEAKFKLQNDLETYLDNIRELNPGLVSSTTASPPPRNLDSSQSSSTPSPRPTSAIFKTTPGKTLSYVARKFQSIASLQQASNNVFGHTLAINIASIVGMSVILKYLVITSFTAHMKPHYHYSSIEAYQGSEDGASEKKILGQGQLLDEPTSENYTENNSTIDWGNVSNSVKDITEETNRSVLVAGHSISLLNPYHLDNAEWIMFLGLDLSLLIRLAIVIISLGRVHQTSLQFNLMMGKAFLTANQVIDELTETLAQNCGQAQADEVGKLMMTSTQTSSILAFINLNNANPVAFSGGGLFLFSRGLLLMIVSIIISYLVFLLQA